MPLIQYPHPVLLQKTQKIKSADEAKFVFEVMIETLELDCTWAIPVGLAANQAMLARRAFIALGQPFFNPIILWRSAGWTKHEEACYSLKPHAKYMVRRHDSIDLQYQDLNMLWHIEHFEGKIAQVIQHEYDHLNGISLIKRQRL